VTYLPSTGGARDMPGRLLELQKEEGGGSSEDEFVAEI
jgi:hypothetical protein